MIVSLEGKSSASTMWDGTVKWLQPSPLSYLHFFLATFSTWFSAFFHLKRAAFRLFLSQKLAVRDGSGRRLRKIREIINGLLFRVSFLVAWLSFRGSVAYFLLRMNSEQIRDTLINGT